MTVLFTKQVTFRYLLPLQQNLAMRTTPTLYILTPEYGLQLFLQSQPFLKLTAFYKNILVATTQRSIPEAQKREENDVYITQYHTDFPAC